jgi:hypothetical protein
MLTGIVGKYFLEVGAEKEIKEIILKIVFYIYIKNW